MRTSFNKEPDGTKNRYTEIRLFLSSGDGSPIVMKTNGSVSNSAYRRAGKGVFTAGDVNSDGERPHHRYSEFASSGGSKRVGSWSIWGRRLDWLVNHDERRQRAI